MKTSVILKITCFALLCFSITSNALASENQKKYNYITSQGWIAEGNLKLSPHLKHLEDLSREQIVLFAYHSKSMNESDYKTSVGRFRDRAKAMEANAVYFKYFTLAEQAFDENAQTELIDFINEQPFLENSQSNGNAIHGNLIRSRIQRKKLRAAYFLLVSGRVTQFAFILDDPYIRNNDGSEVVQRMDALNLALEYFSKPTGVERAPDGNFRRMSVFEWSYRYHKSTKNNHMITYLNNMRELIKTLESIGSDLKEEKNQ